MLPVFICSNSENNLAIYREVVRIYMDNHRITGIRIVCCTSDPDAVSSTALSHDGPSLYILDIFEGGWDNLSFAAVVRKHDPRAYIILFSSDSGCTSDAVFHHTEPLACIYKGDPDTVEQLYVALSTAYRSHLSVSAKMHGIECLQLLHPDNGASIPLRDICYVTSSGTAHFVLVVTEKENVKFRCSLNEISQQLGSSFVRCHRMFIVNAAHIASIDRANLSITMDNGVSVPCSRRLTKKILFHSKPS